MVAFLLLLLSPLATVCVEDPGREFADCVDGGIEDDTCARQIFEAIRPIMGTGIPNLKLPVLPMDPMYVDQIDFKFETVNIEFTGLDVRGLQQFVLKSTRLDKAARKWSVVLFVPRLEVAGKYRINGTLGIDLGVSEGDETFNATDVTLTGVASLESKEDGKINLKSLDLQMEFTKIAIAMDCLFPKEDGSCCPRKWKKSCNPIFAKTIHKFINKDGKAFVAKFQPQISAKFGEIVLTFLNRGLQNLDASYMIE